MSNEMTHKLKDFDTHNYQLALQHHRSNRLEQAEKVYRQLLKNQPEQPEVLYGLGLLEQQRGQSHAAEKMFQAVLRIDPMSFKAWFSLGNLCQERSQWSEAIEAYYQALSIRPEEAAIQNNLGQALEQVGNWEAAIACYQTALSLQPACTAATINLSKLLKSQGYVNAFDIFDTLISRFCISPEEIFHQVESQVENTIGIQAFAHHRQQAEQSLLAGSENYTLDEIYTELGQRLNLSQKQTEMLKATEIAAELENAIGIRENLEKVEANDLLISDMYLPEVVLQRMLKKVGLSKPIRLLVSAKGKRSGRMWQQVIKNHKIAQHTGDNAHSDVKMAQQHGIKAHLYQAAQLSSVESCLYRIGAKHLAKSIRKTRLGNHFNPPEAQDFYNCFIQGNLALLTIFSAYLLYQAEQQNIEQYLFSSRDCYHLHTLFTQIVQRCGYAVQAEYFYTSRLARVNGSQSYLNYISALFNQVEKSAIVDLVGTGCSLSYLLNKLNQISDQSNQASNRAFSPTLIFLHQTQLNRVNQMYQGVEKVNHTFSLIPDIPHNLNIDALEILNYIRQPMVRDVVLGSEISNSANPHSYKPIFLANSTPENILTFISSTEPIVQDFSREITPTLIAELRYEVDPQALSQLAITLYSQLCQNGALLSYFMPFHTDENKQIEQEISSMLTNSVLTL